jgi:pseudouridine-5'-monophosphatase
MVRERVTATIWDLDGLIFDTEQVYDALFQQYAQEKTGRRIPDEEFRPMRARVFGGTALRSAAILHETLAVADSPETHIEWRKHYDLAEQFRQRTSVLPGAQALLTHVRAAGVPMALATSSERSLLEAKAARHPWLWDIFGDNVVAGDEVQHSKPDPELFVKAAKMLGIPREDFGRVLVFEDAPNGVAAAKAAGMKVVAVPHPLLDRGLVAEADQVVASLTEFNPQEWGL